MEGIFPEQVSTIWETQLPKGNFQKRTLTYSFEVLKRIISV